MSEKRPPLVSIDDLAITLGVSVSTVRSWVRDGEIPRQTYIRVGKTYRFEQEEVINALKDVPEPVAAAQPTRSADLPKVDQNRLDSLARGKQLLDKIRKGYARPVKKIDEEKKGEAAKVDGGQEDLEKDY
jgi:excisionase family DNA binding protein